MAEKQTSLKPLGNKSVPLSRELSLAEADIVKLFCDEHLTLKQIAIRRKTRVNTVRKQWHNAALKGALNRSTAEKTAFTFSDPTWRTSGTRGMLRLHGEQFIITILERDERYANLLKVSNQLTIDDCLVKLWTAKIEIYSTKSFFGRDASKCDAEASAFWARFSAKLETNLNVIINKNRAVNWRRVAAHYERMDSEIGAVSVEEQRQIRIYADDGKLRFVTDQSLKSKNHEALHPDTARPDIDRVEAAVDQWLRGQPTPEETAKLINSALELQLKTQEQLGQIAISLHVNALQMKDLITVFQMNAGVFNNGIKPREHEPNDASPSTPPRIDYIG